MSRYTEVHNIANLRGEGDARPTALQIIKDEDLVGKLACKVFLVTGVSAGLGIETVRALHATGADIYGTARNIAKAEIAMDKIRSENLGTGKVELVKMDLEDFTSIRQAAATILEKTNGTLNVIVANAGIMATPYRLTSSASLLSSASPTFPSRYVSVSSKAHVYSTVHFTDYNYKQTPYSPWSAYGQAKTANIWMSNSIERQYGSKHLHSTSIQPGGIINGTELGQYLPEEDKEVIALPENLPYFKNVEQGAATQVFAAVSSEWAHRGGRYLADCAEASSREDMWKVEGMTEMFNHGFAEWAYDEGSEERLWKESFGMVGLDVPVEEE